MLLWFIFSHFTGWPQFFTHRELHGGVLNREGKLEVRAEVTTNWERRVDHVQSLTSADLLQGILAELNTLRQEMAGLQAWVSSIPKSEYFKPLVYPGQNDSPWGPSEPGGEVAEVRQVRGESAASRSVVPVPRRTRHLRGVRGQCWGRIHRRMLMVMICYCIFAVYRLMFVHSARRVSAVGPAVWRPTWGTCLLPTNNLIKLNANLC